MIIEDEDSLKVWIMKDVGSLTDADADRLALYVIALLKKPLSDDDLVELCLDKLDVFLQNHTKDFVDRLFLCIKEGTYLPEEAQTAELDDIVLTDGSDIEEEMASKPTDDEKSVLKSSDNKTRHSDRASTAGDSKSTVKLDTKSNSATGRSSRRRISPPATSADRETARYGRGAPLSRSPVRNRRGTASNYKTSRGNRSDRYHRRRSWSRSRSPRSRSRSPQREKRRDEHESVGRRHRCRDFHEKGFCMRGDKCVYDHGPDPVVIENSALEKIVSRSTTTTSTLYSTTNPPPPGVDRVFGSGVSETYNPEAPALTAATGLGTTAPAVGKIDFTVPPPPLPPHLATAPVVPTPYSTGVASSSALVTVVPNVQPFNTSTSIVPGALAGIPQDPSLSSNYMYGNGNAAQHPQTFITRRGAGRGRFKPYGSAPRVNPALCSLLVKKIPLEQNKIVLLDQHFGKFGQITNLHVQYEGQPDTALVTFKSRREALAAYKSTEPIFNNRFIKVYWQTQPPEVENDDSTAAVANNGTSAMKPSGIPLSIGSQQPLSEIPVQTNLNRPFSKTFTQNAEAVIEPTFEKIEPVDFKDEQKPAMLKTLPIPEIAMAENIPKRPVYNPRVLAAKKKAEKENLKRLLDVHRRKTELYQKQIDQQRDLLQKIQATDNRELKKKYLELVKRIEELTKTAKVEIEMLGKQISLHQEKQLNEQLQQQAFVDSRIVKNEAVEEQKEEKASEPLSIVPDGERKPSDRVTPAALLASLDEDDEEEDDIEGGDDLLDDEDSTAENDNIDEEDF